VFQQSLDAITTARILPRDFLRPILQLCPSPAEIQLILGEIARRSLFGRKKRILKQQLLLVLNPVAKKMTQLKSLTFAALPRLTAADPVIQRRNKLIVRLQQQIALVQDPQFTLTRQKWITDEAGVKQLRSLPKKVVHGGARIRLVRSFSPSATAPSPLNSKKVRLRSPWAKEKGSCPQSRLSSQLSKLANSTLCWGR
jgi:hypothetical protein